MPATFPYPLGYGANSHCEFDMDAPRHVIDNYCAFLNRVQDSIESKAVTFTLTGPDVKTDPMPTHGRAYVSSIEEVDEKELIKKVQEIQNPIIVIGTQLMKYGLIPTNHGLKMIVLLI